MILCTIVVVVQVINFLNCAFISSSILY